MYCILWKAFSLDVAWHHTRAFDDATRDIDDDVPRVMSCHEGRKALNRLQFVICRFWFYYWPFFGEGNRLETYKLKNVVTKKHTFGFIFPAGELLLSLPLESPGGEKVAFLPLGAGEMAISLSPEQKKMVNKVKPETAKLPRRPGFKALQLML